MKKLREIIGEMYKKSDLGAIDKHHRDSFVAAKMRSPERDFHGAQGSRARRLISVRNGLKPGYKLSDQLEINKQQKGIAKNAQAAIEKRDEKKRKK